MTNDVQGPARAEPAAAHFTTAAGPRVSERMSAPGAKAHDAPLWALFDAEWYLDRYRLADELSGEARRASAAGIYREMSVTHHHSPNPYFHEAWYLQAHPEVAQSVKDGTFASGFEHYKAVGYIDRSPHWLFSEAFYRMANPDLTRVRLEECGFINGYHHYLGTGDGELRQGSLFLHPETYVRTVGLERPPEATPVGPFAHFVRGFCGTKVDARLSWYFDPVWYLETYPEVEAEIQSGLYSCALEHYLRNPTPTRFDPSRFFSEEFYSSLHLDVADVLAQGRFRNAYDHFVQFGAFEKRRPHADVDLERYFASVSVQADIESGLMRDAYSHFVARASSGAPPETLDPIDESQSKRLFSLRATNLATRHARRPLDFMVEGEPAVSAIVVMHNQIEQTLAALDSLRRAGPRHKIELILVDSGSTDETREIRRFVNGARLIRFERNVGFVEACNGAVREASAPATLFLNNDAVIEGDSVHAALDRLHSASTIGAVGGKIIRSNGLLQEAGCIIWRDGSTSGYLRDCNPNIPEANFVRDVDFCSGAFLLVRTSILRETGGFDEDYKPAYFEESDLCIKIQQMGYRIVYDPAVVVSHYEYATGDAAIARIMMERNQPKFRAKNQRFLLGQPERGKECSARARHARSDRRRRILFIEDRVPFRTLGSGFTRSNDIIHAMARLGYHVTVFPVFKAIESVLGICREFSDQVEVIHDRELPDLRAFLDERAGYFDIVWVARIQNADRCLGVLQSASQAVPMGGLVLDTEAIASQRIFLKRRLLGVAETEEDLQAATARELSSANSFHTLVAVSRSESELIRAAGHDNVEVLGHVQVAKPGAVPFEQRHGLLFVGAIHDAESPNLDSVTWFVEQVLPKLEGRIPADDLFTIAGYVNRRVDLTRLGRARRVDLRGPQEELAPLYRAHRVFVAPTRFAAGIPYKLHEAASYGIPIVATDLLAAQLDWMPGTDLLTASSTDPEEFAAQVVVLYNSRQVWESTRSHALARIEMENAPAGYDARLRRILEKAVDHHGLSAEAETI